MKFLKGLLKTIIILIMILVIVGLFLPDRAHVERFAAIQAPPEKIFEYVNNVKAFNQWSPWFERDPNMQIRYAGPESGVGARMSWSSEHPQVGSGSQEIVKSEPHTYVESELDFGSEGTAVAFFRLRPAGAETEVLWGFDTEFGYNLFGRYFGLMFDSWVGADFEQGLSNLKKLAEAG